VSQARLQVILSRAGIASRRKAEEYIAAGRVAVNGKIVKEPGTKADPAEDVITIDGKTIGEEQEKATVLMYKPVQVVTTLSDPRERETVAELLDEEPYRFVPIGRLDYLTEGALLLTTDGELVNRLLHPKYHVPKVYSVKVRGRPTEQKLEKLRVGVMLEDGKTKPAIVDVIEEDERDTWIQLVVSEGRNRLVRRMCDAISHPALRVVRTEFATIALGELKPGTYRYLDKNELLQVYRSARIKNVPKPCKRAQEVGVRRLGKARRGKGRVP
jgi:23S rRNA pseudouridine2605 synthase